MCTLYLSGLFMVDGRRTVRRISERTAQGNYNRLHHFITAAKWDEVELENELLLQADLVVGGRDAILVFDDLYVPKKSDRSIGATEQYVSVSGKSVNCQLLVLLTLVRKDRAIALASRLFVPERWAVDAVRLRREGISEEYRSVQDKAEVALIELDRALLAGVHFGCVLANVSYGQNALFRRALSARGLKWIVEIRRQQRVYSCDVTMTSAVDTGKRRQRLIPNVCSLAAERALSEMDWQRVDVAHKEGATRNIYYEAGRRRVADGPPVRVRGRGLQNMPGDEVWLIAERLPSGEKNYYLSNFGTDVSLAFLASSINAQRISEQSHHQFRRDVGFGHYEGRSWRGLHRHGLMCMIVGAFLQSQCFADVGRKKTFQTVVGMEQGSSVED